MPALRVEGRKAVRQKSMKKKNCTKKLLELIWEQITKSLRHAVAAGPQGQTIHLTRQTHTNTRTCYALKQKVIKEKFLQVSVCACVTCACVLGSSRRRHPTWEVLVWTTPAPTKFAGLGSTASSSATPKPKIWQTTTTSVHNKTKTSSLTCEKHVHFCLFLCSRLYSPWCLKMSRKTTTTAYSWHIYVIDVFLFIFWRGAEGSDAASDRGSGSSAL